MTPTNTTTKRKEIKARFINWLIKTLKVDTNQVSDGYHTFEELYEHRICIWLAFTNKHKYDVDYWKSKKHSDGSSWEGWFILGYGKKQGEQITYHLPMEYWELSKVTEYYTAPEYDGHTPEDVIERLKVL